MVWTTMCNCTFKARSLNKARYENFQLSWTTLICIFILWNFYVSAFHSELRAFLISPHISTFLICFSTKFLSSNLPFHLNIFSCLPKFFSRGIFLDGDYRVLLLFPLPGFPNVSPCWGQHVLSDIWDDTCHCITISVLPHLPWNSAW